MKVWAAVMKVGAPVVNGAGKFMSGGGPALSPSPSPFRKGEGSMGVAAAFG